MPTKLGGENLVTEDQGSKVDTGRTAVSCVGGPGNSCHSQAMGNSNASQHPTRAHALEKKSWVAFLQYS